MKLSHGSQYVEAPTKEGLLDIINNHWESLYNKYWQGGEYSYELLQHIQITYFKDDFDMTSEEAQAKLDELDERGLSNMMWAEVKLKLCWYIKYGKKKTNVNDKQMNIYDYLEEEK